MPNVVSINVVADTRSAQESLRALELQMKRLKDGPLGGLPGSPSAGSGRGASDAGARAAESLQRQRSAALIRQVKETERASAAEAQATVRAAQVQARAAESLQRQRSAALTQQLREEQRADQARVRSAQAANGRLYEGLRRGVNPVGRGATSARGGRASEAAEGALGGLGIPIGAASIGAAAAGGALAFVKASIGAHIALEESSRLVRTTAVLTGQSLDDVTKRATAFAKATGQSQADANKTFSGIATFTSQAGQNKNADRFTKAFTDLSSARGIKAGDLGDIARQLSTLQDEATDRLLGANPSAFYDDYARGIGKSADALTDAEKRAAVFFAVIKEGEKVSGAAIDRFNTLGGQVDKLQGNFTDFIAKIGGKVAPAITAGLQLDAGLNFGAYQSQQDSVEYQKRHAIINDETKKLNEAKRQRELAIRGRVNPFESFEVLEAARGKDDAKKFRADRQGEFLDFTGKFDPEDKNSAQLFAAQRKSFEQLKNIFSAEDQKRIGDSFRAVQEEIDKAAEEAHKKALERFKELKEASLETTRNLFAARADNNPFSSLLTRFEETRLALRERFKDLGGDLRGELESVQDKTFTRDLFGLRLDSQVRALSLRQEARDLRAGPLNAQTAPDAVLDPFLKLSSAERLTGVDATNKRQGEILRLERLQGSNPALRQRLAELREEDEKDPLAQFTRGLGALANRQAAGGIVANLPGLFSLPQMAQAATAGDAVGKVREQLRLIEQLAAQGGDIEGAAALADRKILSITGTLNPEELSPDLKRGRIGALEREANRAEREEQDAITDRKERKALEERLTKAIERLTGVLDTGIPLALDVKSNDGTQVQRLGAVAPEPVNVKGLGDTYGRQR